MSESIAHIWAELETVLGGCLSDGERDVWMNDALAYSDGKMAFDTLVEKIRDARTFYGARPHRPQRAGKMHHPPSIMEGASKENGGSGLTRTEVLAEFIVVHATQDPAVRQFREEVLQGKLLPWSEIQGWVTQQRQRETEQELSRAFLKVPLPPNHHFHPRALWSGP